MCYYDIGDNMKISKVEFLFKLLIVIISGIGLYLNFRIAPVRYMILYFTIISNLAVFIFYLVTLILYLTKKLKRGDLYHMIKGMITIDITLTLVVYNLFLRNVEFYQDHLIACTFVHLITPTLVMLDYVIFSEKGNLKTRYPVYWSLSIVAYGIFCYVYEGLGGKFLDGSTCPYYYMDVNKYGFIGVTIFSITIFMSFLAYGYLILYLDTVSSKCKNIKFKK